jgi:dienelactone hydrolase
MRAFLAMCLFAFSATAQADMRADPVSWSDGGRKFDGVLVWDDVTNDKRPGILMVPNWWGVNDVAIEKAKTIAGRDYVVLLVDMYGRTPRPTNAAEAGKAAGAVFAAGNGNAPRSRSRAALAAFRKAGRNAPVDTTRIGAIGFCFGGAVVLELARSGADLDGVATFHASLDSKKPATAGAFRTPLLVMNGADDGFVSHESIDGFQKEMADAGADWQFVNFGGAKHCFAEPDEHGQVPGCEYHEPSYRRSMAMMRGFFAERFED